MALEFTFLPRLFITRLSGKLRVLKVQATTISSRKLKGLYLINIDAHKQINNTVVVILLPRKASTLLQCVYLTVASENTHRMRLLALL